MRCSPARDPLLAHTRICLVAPGGEILARGATGRTGLGGTRRLAGCGGSRTRSFREPPLHLRLLLSGVKVPWYIFQRAQTPSFMKGSPRASRHQSVKMGSIRPLRVRYGVIQRTVATQALLWSAAYRPGLPASARSIHGTHEDMRGFFRRFDGGAGCDGIDATS
jgi:hypothetical protein